MLSYKKPGFWARLRQGNLSETQLAVLLVLPALIILAMVMFYPIATVLWQSLHLERLTRPQEGVPFVGLRNFQRMFWGTNITWDLSHLFGWRILGMATLLPLWWLAWRGSLKRSSAILWTTVILLFFLLWLGFHPAEGGRWSDPRFWNSFNITMLIIVVSVAGSFLVGLPLALLANVRSPLRWLVRAALLLPWAMPRVLTAIMFAWLFQSQGVINDVLGRIGIQGPLWLARVEPAIVAANLTIIWATSSFVGLILLAGLQSIDDSLYEAARVDGADAWQRFWSITLPLLRPSIAVALIFRTLTAIQTFDIPIGLTNAGPGRALETLGVYIQRSTIDAGNIGYAAALSVALFALSLVITIMYLRWIYADD